MLIPQKPALVLAQNNIRGFRSDLVAGSPEDAGSPEHAEAGVGARAPANAAAPDHGRAVHQNVRSPDDGSTPKDRTAPSGASGVHKIDRILRGVIHGGGRKGIARGYVRIRESRTNVQKSGSDGENIVLADIDCTRNGI